MAFYDYRCPECGHEEKDIKRNMSENVSVYECSKCQAEMKQIISVFGFKLKGQGWYESDYKRKNIKEDS